MQLPQAIPYLGIARRFVTAETPLLGFRVFKRYLWKWAAYTELPRNF
jgi:hypothetical protein